MSTKKLKLYNKAILTRKIELEISEVGGDIENTLKQKLLDLLDGKCSVEGYIKKGSINIKSYSSGSIIRGSVILFEVLFSTEICLPVENMLLKNVTVDSITKAGIRGSFKNIEDNPIVSYIIRDHFSNNTYFNSIKVGDLINIKVIGVRFEINDSKIYVIGELSVNKKLKVKTKQ